MSKLFAKSCTPTPSVVKPERISPRMGPGTIT